MTEKDIQIISEEYKDEKEPLYEKIHERVEEMIEHQAKKRKRLNTFYKFFPVSLAMVLIISLAIILPIVLQPSEEEPPINTAIRYSDNELDSKIQDYTLKDYARINNLNYLYIDLYETAEDLLTRRYFKIGNESETAYLQETFTDGETGYIITLTIMKNNINVENFEEALSSPKEIDINNVSVTYSITMLDSKANFEYQDYKYYLEFDDEIDVEYLTAIISNMFNTQQAAA